MKSVSRKPFCWDQQNGRHRMLKPYKIILLAVFCYANTCAAEIIHTNDFKVIQKQLQKANTDTLVIFDVDDVIIQPTDQIIKSINQDYLLERTMAVAKHMPEKEIMHLRSIIMLSLHYELVDPQLTKTLAELKKQHIPAIALTHCGTGRQGKIPKLEDWRIQQLKKFGVDFSTMNNLADYSFPEIPAKYGIPIFQSGIIFTAFADKGVVLKAVLEKANMHPKEIIFIDDKLKNIKSVEIIAQQQHIKYIGIEYTAAKDRNIEPLNIPRADFQFEVLEKEHKWLSDQQVDERMLSGS